MGRIIIANCNPILNDVQSELVLKYNAFAIKNQSGLDLAQLKEIEPEYIFFMHWSWIIPEEIFKTYNCIVFHMTDLPYGRGGSPLQNLIIRGHKETKITALKVDQGIDTGDIYLKKKLNLDGTAREIFLNTGEVIKEMIDDIVKSNLQPIKQEGTPVLFSRRKQGQSLIPNDIDDIEKLYDFIRMLDADNYPHAFLQNNVFKFEITDARIENNDELIANVRITKK